MSADELEGWAVLELMGHRRLAGWVSEVEFAGGKFIRLDVPKPTADQPTGARPGPEETFATQLYGATAIYCLTPTDETTARAVARASAVAPVSRWELRAGDPQAVDEDAWAGG